MQSIFSSNRINKRLFAFIFFFSLSLWLIISSHVYHKSQFISSANWLSGSIFNIKNSLNSYLKLEEYNKVLIWENKYLRGKLFNQYFEKKSGDDPLSDEILSFKFKEANVIKNSFSKSINYLTIDKGTKDGVEKEMGVITPKGVIGVVESVSLHFSSVRSILSTNMSVNAKIKNSDIFGTIVWEGYTPYKLKLQDIPKLVNVSIGDTIVTAGMSYIFPKGIKIGTVHDFKKHDFDNYYTIDVSLLNDPTQLSLVYLVKNNFKEELEELEKNK